MPEIVVGHTPGPRRGARSKARRRAALWIRRAHLYAGLLLLPWVLFFGVSAIAFNHAGSRSSVEPPRRISAKEVRARTGLEPLDPKYWAAELSAQLSSSEHGELQLDDSFAPQFTGPAAFTLETEAGRRVIRLDLGSASAQSDFHEREALGPRAPFVDAALEAPELDLDAMAQALGAGMPDLASDPEASLEPFRRHGPSLVFRVRDAEQGLWNLSYELGSGELSARAAAADSGYGPRRLLARLHMLHGYGQSDAARLAWIVFADLTAALLIFWALSGLFMWTQMKRLRKIGAFVTLGGFVVAALIFATAASSVSFMGTPAARGDAR